MSESLISFDAPVKIPSKREVIADITAFADRATFIAKETSEAKNGETEEIDLGLKVNKKEDPFYASASRYSKLLRSKTTTPDTYDSHIKLFSKEYEKYRSDILYKKGEARFAWIDKKSITIVVAEKTKLHVSAIYRNSIKEGLTDYANELIRDLVIIFSKIVRRDNENGTNDREIEQLNQIIAELSDPPKIPTASAPPNPAAAMPNPFGAGGPDLGSMLGPLMSQLSGMFPQGMGGPPATTPASPDTPNTLNQVAPVDPNAPPMPAIPQMTPENLQGMISAVSSAPNIQELVSGAFGLLQGKDPSTFVQSLQQLGVNANGNGPLFPGAPAPNVPADIPAPPTSGEMGAE